jgi:hypothetical protein
MQEFRGLDRGLVAWLREELGGAGYTERQAQRYLKNIREIYKAGAQGEEEAEREAEAAEIKQAAADRENRGRYGKPRYRRD